MKTWKALLAVLLLSGSVIASGCAPVNAPLFAEEERTQKVRIDDGW